MSLLDGWTHGSHTADAITHDPCSAALPRRRRYRDDGVTGTRFTERLRD